MEEAAPRGLNNRNPADFSVEPDEPPMKPRISAKKKMQKVENKIFKIMQDLEQNFCLVRFVIKTVKWVPPAMIFGVFLFCYYVMCYLFCYRQLYEIKGDYILATLIVLVFNIIFALTNISFYKAIYTDPGFVPDEFYERVKNQSLDALEIEEEGRMKSAKFPVYDECKHCLKPKPPRSHHCKHCRKCVRKMDHHCPVVNNCVGWRNYKFFLLLLTWADIMCFFGVFCGIIKFIFVGLTDNISVEIQICLGLFISVIYSLMLVAFAGMHYYMVFGNTGTLDSVVPLFKKQKNIYNIGAMNNFKQIFGNDPIYWLLPVFTAQGDGCSFPMNEGAKIDDNFDEQENVASVETDILIGM